MKKNPEKNLRDVILSLNQYTAGKSIQEISSKYHIHPNKIIKLGSNENVLGPSPKAVNAIKKVSSSVNIYPPVTSRDVAEKIKKVNKVSADIEVFLGNGMDQVFEMLARLFLNNGDETIISVPTFTCYELVTLWAGGKPKLIPLTNDFQLDVDKILKNITKKTKIIFICSPNNPTGNLMKEKDIKKILDSTNCMVFLDEAYIEFSGKSHVKWISKYPNLIIGRTFSKIYGLAGQRIGYTFIHKNLAKFYLNSLTPFVVTSTGQAAAIAALDDKIFVNKSKKLVRDGLIQYKTEFNKYNIDYLPSDANFITVKTNKHKSSEVALKLQKKGIIVRDCEKFGLRGEKLLRITIGTKIQNKKVIEELKDVLK